MKAIFMAIIAFFASIFGKTTNVVEQPEQPVFNDSVIEEEYILEVGDYLDIKVCGDISASAQLMQTNGNQFTVLIHATAEPGTIIAIISAETVYQFTVDDNGELYASILTNSVELSIEAI